MLRVFQSHRCVLIFLVLMFSFSQASQGIQFFNLRSNQNSAMDFKDFLKSIPKGSLVVIGEAHNFQAIQNGQIKLLNGLRHEHHQIDVGLEFFQYEDQDLVDRYRDDRLKEKDFLTQVWGLADFKFYRTQTFFPLSEFGEKTIAINAPKKLIEYVSKEGMSSLPPDIQTLVPPQFQIGSDAYFTRFKERMAGHVISDEVIRRRFEAQSLKDDTLAWKICEAKQKSSNTLVAIVGYFHIEYGQGLIERLVARCPGLPAPIVTIYEHLLFESEDLDLNLFYSESDHKPISDFLMTVQDTEV